MNIAFICMAVVGMICLSVYLLDKYVAPRIKVTKNDEFVNKALVASLIFKTVNQVTGDINNNGKT